jgi:hypothetical protein
MSADETIDQTTTTTTEQPGTTPPAPSIPDPNETPEAKAAREAQDRDDQGRFRRPAQERINEAVRKQREAEREASYWRGRAEGGKKPDAAPAADEPKPKPTADQFDDYGAYVEALTDWKAEQRVTQAFQQRETTERQQTVEETRAANWSKGIDAVLKIHPDYHDVMAVSDVPVAQHVQDLLLDSEMGPRLAYHLDRHPDVADRLNKMSPTAAAREIGRIEASFTPIPASEEPPADTTATDTARPAVPAAAKPRTTAAPPPAKPTGSGRSAQIPLEKQSMDQYVATRIADGASWARR